MITASASQGLVRITCLILSIFLLIVSSTTPFAQENWSEQSKKYASMVHRLDQGVGQIVEQLNELGLRENTLIIFTSDNGGHQDVWNESL